MKKLNSVQELWSYCLYCPICKDITREPRVVVGPDGVFNLSKFDKQDKYLILDTLFLVKDQKYKINFKIDCIQNTFEVDFSKPIKSETNINHSPAAYFFFFIESDCRVCDATYVNGSDLELDLLGKTITDIHVEREGIYFLKDKTKFYLTFDYIDNKMLISKCFEDEKTGEIIDENKPFSFPIVNLDFSDHKKLLNRIKTILLFS